MFNFIPDLPEDEFRDTMNDWLNEVQISDVDPLSKEGLCRDTVQSNVQSAQAVPSRGDLAVLGTDGIVVDGKEVLITKNTIEEWLEDAEYSLRQAKEYLQPIMEGDTRRLRLDGKRVMWWPFDKVSIEENGYVVPDPKSAAGEEGDTDEAENEEVESV